jgi:hypothetical protein
MEDKGRGQRSINTVNGRIEPQRKHWYSEQCGTVTPLDRLVDAAESTVSVGLRELSCQLGRDSRSMERAKRSLKSAAGVLMGEDKLRLLVESEGKAILAASGDEQLELDWSAAGCKTATPAGMEVSRVYATGDGVMIPVTTQAEKEKRRATVQERRKAKRPAKGARRRRRLGTVKKGEDQRYKQFWITSMHDQDQTHRLVGVTRGDHRRLGQLLRRDAARVRLRGAEERLGMVDGAVCLRNHMEVLPLTDLNLDFYHLGEHVHEGKRSTFGEKSEAGEQWAGEVLHAVRHEGYEPFWDQLTEWRARQRAPGKRKAANGLMHYAAERKDMVNFKELQERGCLIGTGPIESMCKAVPLRVKGPGMRWDSDNAEAMMALEALEQSNLWDRYWTKALQAVTYSAITRVPG